MSYGTFGGRSHFSVGEAVLSPDELAEECAKAGMTFAALTDTMTVSGMTQFTAACLKHGIKPIIGVRLRIVDDPTWRKTPGVKVKKPQEWFPKLIALNEKGIRIIYRLLTLANSEDRFYEVPRLGILDVIDEIEKTPGQNVAFLTGDTFSFLTHPNIATYLGSLRTATRDHAYIEVSPIDTPLWDRANHKAAQFAADGYKVVKSAPVLYRKGEATRLDVISTISRNVNFLKPVAVYLPHIRDFHALTAAEYEGKWRAMVARAVKAAVSWASTAFADDLHDTVTYIWKKMAPSLPVMATDEMAELRKLVVDGWNNKLIVGTFGHRPTPHELETVYKPRLVYELGVLKKLNFGGYFLLVADIVNWSKKSGIRVGPGRGSVGGSLVAYLVGITDCDPIRFGLLFERFINPERIDLPDADLDFMSERRHEVVDYITAKYGAEYVAGISNYATLQSAAALRDTSKAFGYEDLTISKLMPKLHGKNIPLVEAADEVAEIAKFRDENPEIWSHAVSVEGLVRTLGRHAAGVVVSGVPLTERAAVERRQGSPTVNWDKVIAEDQGLVKLDVLGLQTLDIMELALQYIFKRHGTKVDLNQLALDDPKVLDSFSAGKTVGIFQFESSGMRKLLKDLASTSDLTFDDIAAATALYRPGPMDSGLMQSFVNRKIGNETIAYPHAVAEDALKDTYGVFVYQEQVMRLARDMAGFTLPEADKLRKAMGKKDPVLMASFRDKFVDGCATTISMDKTQAFQLWQQIEKFAGYGFNKSHSVEYSLISYQSMWLKSYYPVEFFAAALTLVKDEKLPALLRDTTENGILILPPDINESSDVFEILNDTTLLVPFNRVKGVSDNTAAAIIKARIDGKFKDKADFLDRVERRRCNSMHTDRLDRVGAFARIEPGQPPSVDGIRLKDQVELMPGLVVESYAPRRDLVLDTHAIREIKDVVAGYQSEFDVAVKPHVGKRARFVVIFDGPSAGEDAEGQMAKGFTFGQVSEALHVNGLERADAYWTALCKIPKPKSGYPNEIINQFAPYLERELDTLKPPLLLLMGSTVARHFIKDLKGSIDDHIGKTIYDAKRDATMIVGMNPAVVHFNPSRQSQLDDLFAKAKELTDY